MPAPIVVFAFNRPGHLRRTLSSLAANELAAESDVTVFCDGPRNDKEKGLTDAVRELALGTNGFHSVTVLGYDQNMGCANAVIGGLEYCFTRHERLIVMEDDILCSPHTLRFLNTCLEKYEQETTVFNISAWTPPPRLMPPPQDYPYDAYCVPRFHCWGWASWRDRWAKVDWDVADYAQFAHNACLRQAYNRGGHDMSPMLDMQMEGKINSWAIRMDYARFKHGGLGLNPVVSYTHNTGMGSGTHTTYGTNAYDNDVSLALPEPRLPDHIFLDNAVTAAYRKVPERVALCARGIVHG